MIAKVAAEEDWWVGLETEAEAVVSTYEDVYFNVMSCG